MQRSRREIAYPRRNDECCSSPPPDKKTPAAAIPTLKQKSQNAHRNERAPTNHEEKNTQRLESLAKNPPRTFSSAPFISRSHPHPRRSAIERTGAIKNIGYAPSDGCAESNSRKLNNDISAATHELLS